MKIKEFWTKNKKTVLRGLAAAGIIVAVSVAIFLVLLAFKVVYFDDGMKLNAALVESFRSSAWGIIGFILVEAVLFGKLKGGIRHVHAVGKSFS